MANKKSNTNPTPNVITYKVDDGYRDDWIPGSSNTGWFNGKNQVIMVNKASSIIGGDEHVLNFQWFQAASNRNFYFKLFYDDGGTPGNEFYSKLINGSKFDGWTLLDIYDENLGYQSFLLSSIISKICTP